MRRPANLKGVAGLDAIALRANTVRAGHSTREEAPREFPRHTREARLYWESHLAFFAPKNVPFPAAVSAFEEELYQAPKSWTEKAYPKLIFYNRHDKGSHFAAWEQPQLLVADLRAAFKSLR